MSDHVAMVRADPLAWPEQPSFGALDFLMVVWVTVVQIEVGA
jgi:hypothetical protein